MKHVAILNNAQEYSSGREDASCDWLVLHVGCTHDHCRPPWADPCTYCTLQCGCRDRTALYLVCTGFTLQLATTFSNIQ